MKVDLYTNSNGRCPVQEFISEQKPEDQALILVDLDNLRVLGHLIREPLSKLLRDGIFELRTRTQTGQFRLLYFFFHNNQAVVTHGFLKKKPKTPGEEIDKAIKYRNDYLNQKREKK